jgi:hypothetical protein
MGKRPNTVRLRYGYNTAHNSAPDNTVQYRPKTSRFYTVYCRKGSVFTAFTVRFRVVTDAVLIDLGILQDYNFDRSLSLPYDRYRLPNDHRSGRGKSISFDFNHDLSHRFLSYALSDDMALQYMVLTCYYAFSFKLTNGEKDLCIGMNTHDRYKEELISVKDDEKFSS